MFKGKKFLAIIPARSGSKGLKDKNIMELNGKPLIAYTIEVALKSGIFDEIIVSTDSEVYARIAREFGASVPFLRPNKFASDTSSSLDVIIHTLDELFQNGHTYDYLMLLQPTSPLRTSEDIVNATRLLFEKKANSIVSVCEVEHSPLLMNTLSGSLSMENFIFSENNKRRQDLLIYYRLNGAIYLSDINYFLHHRNFYSEKSFAYIMNKLNSIDIDTEIDFELAKIILNKKST